MQYTRDDISENLQEFENLVRLRYQIYNSVFLTLNLGDVHQTGILLPIFYEYCREGFHKGKDPLSIIESYFNDQKNALSDEDQVSLIFQMIQYMERQVVLIDALEDAAFSKVNDLSGTGTYPVLFHNAQSKDLLHELKESLRDYKVRIVLTAHPTQFYPGSVLGIITDLTHAVRQNNIEEIRSLLIQLGKTPFFKKQKPTPFDEAISLGWYLENIFYDAISELYEQIYNSLGDDAEELIGQNSLIELGFWPGGDRDGNPFVNVKTTLLVADRLRNIILKCYYRDIRKLKRKLTFKIVADQLAVLENHIYQSIIQFDKDPEISAKDLADQVLEIEHTLKKHHSSLFVDQVVQLRHKIMIFGYHFACLDIRQDSSEIVRTIEQIVEKYPELLPSDYNKKTLSEKADYLFEIEGAIDAKEFSDPLINDTISSFPAIRQIQKRNGQPGAHRFIVSNCGEVFHISCVYALAKLSGWKYPMDLDMIPLFETIDDLKVADRTMEKLYSHAIYRKHLESRENKQVIMLGFSDGTKDGGYLSANWEIYKAKERLTEVSRQFGIKVVFFDGRGGPPARGGGNTHKFYASLGKEIENDEIQLTIQGQTISSKFGTIESAKYNIEQLLTAGIQGKVFESPERNLSNKQRELIEALSNKSLDVYTEFKNHPLFIPYLEEMSPLHFYSQTNIGSRPAKRGGASKLSLTSLRAIPFVGAWSQLKQNVPGFYGLGASFSEWEQKEQLNDLKFLYSNSLFFQTMIENSMQSLCKTYFPLTEYMSRDTKFGEFWTLIYKEYKNSVDLLLKVSGQKELLERNPTIRESIKMREEVVLPLLTIQQYALMKIRILQNESNMDEEMEIYKKMVIRSLFGNINASRNSA